ncbi:MAG: hypothetical protein IKO19_04175 [Candidatus Riflebacteria bacterium]|nr:hypothetical protein [Candidatus Riflebacteria bacterium]
MQKDILHDRYDFTEDDKAIIDITLETINDLFNSFDRKTTFYKRELDQDFEDYLISSVKELDGHSFIIKVEIENNYDKISEEPIRKAIKNHFRFLYWKERRKIFKAIMKFFILLLLGIALMAFYYEHSRFITNFNAIPMYSKIIIEGINIAGWVAFWEAFTCLIFDFIPISRNRKIYESISKSGIRIGKL